MDSIRRGPKICRIFDGQKPPMGIAHPGRVEKNDSRQQVLDIIKGGIYEDLRRVSANFVANDNFFGQVTAGSLGGIKSQMHEVVEMIGQLVDRICLSIYMPLEALQILGMA
jgi:queuine/archaeosine tRNA-ribosyltransferase